MQIIGDDFVKKVQLKQEKEELEKKLSELGDAGITVNKNTVPGETRSPFVTSGIRIGSPALTARGMKEKEFEYIANKICDVLDNIENIELHKKIALRNS